MIFSSPGGSPDSVLVSCEMSKYVVLDDSKIGCGGTRVKFFLWFLLTCFEHFYPPVFRRLNDVLSKGSAV